MWVLPIVLVCSSLAAGANLKSANPWKSSNYGWNSKAAGSNLKVEYQWKSFDYVWESADQKEQAIASGVYNKSKIILNEFDFLPDGQILVTLPKWRGDNPASLAVVSKVMGPGGYLVKPYPNWAVHSTKDCSGLTTIDRIRRDGANRLWAVDTGRVFTEQRCQPKIIAIDLTTNKIVKTVPIPDGVFVKGGILDVQAIDWDAKNVKDVTLYISDYRLGAMLIYHGGKVWRLENSVFKADPKHVMLDIDGDVFNLTAIGGNLGTVAIPPQGYFAENWVIFKPAASVKLFFARREELLASRKGGKVKYYVSDYTMPTQQLYEYVTGSGIMFGSASSEVTLTCWNIKNPLSDEYMHYYKEDPIRLNYIFGLKTKQVLQSCGTYKEQLWVASNLILKFFASTMDFDNHVNFYILSGYVNDLVAGTPCDPVKVVAGKSEDTSKLSKQQKLKHDLDKISLKAL